MTSRIRWRPYRLAVAVRGPEGRGGLEPRAERVQQRRRHRVVDDVHEPGSAVVARLPSADGRGLGWAEHLRREPEAEPLRKITPPSLR